jgi:hypothetical protein
MTSFPTERNDSQERKQFIADLRLWQPFREEGSAVRRRVRKIHKL